MDAQQDSSLTRMKNQTQMIKSADLLKSVIICNFSNNCSKKLRLSGAGMKKASNRSSSLPGLMRWKIQHANWHTVDFSGI